MIRKSNESIDAGATDPTLNSRRRKVARTFGGWLRGVWVVEPTQDWSENPNNCLTPQQTYDVLVADWQAAQQQADQAQVFAPEQPVVVPQVNSGE